MMILLCGTLAGVAVIVAWVLAVSRADLRWRAASLQCCRCLRTWTGIGKRCARCGARGAPLIETRPVRLPTHDWQGRLDTGPIPVVEPVE